MRSRSDRPIDVEGLVEPCKRVIEIAKASELFQIRSHSGGESAANRALKLSTGFGVHPITRNGDSEGAYFILPLSALTRISDKQ